MTRLCRWAPPVARLALNQAIRQAARPPEKFSQQFDRELSAPDLELHRDPQLREAVREIFRESTKTGPRGVIEDYRIWASPSGLDYTAVKCPVRIWHGADDHIVPLHHAQYAAERIRQAEFTVIPGAGHLHTPARWRDVITTARHGAIE
jgi:pimeloyl-ACP methyl ester carboxylesterase